MLTQPRKVADIMTRDVKTCIIGDTVLDAAKIMDRHEIGCVVAVDKSKPAGILTERDILKRVILKNRPPAETLVATVMSKPLVTVRPSKLIQKAAQMMVKKEIKKLVVTNSSRLMGILSLTDLIPLLETQNGINGLALQNAPKRVKRVFEVYYDPIRQLRKKCPLTMMGGTSISCIGPKCMWYVQEKCAILTTFAQ